MSIFNPLTIKCCILFKDKTLLFVTFTVPQRRNDLHLIFCGAIISSSALLLGYSGGTVQCVCCR